MLKVEGVFQGMNLTKDKYFIDTNIVIYLFSDDIEKRDISKTIITNAITNGYGVISFQVIQEFCNVALKKFIKPMTTNECKQFINNFLNPICRVYPNIDLYNYALDIKSETGYSFYDCLMISGAYISECKILYSEDLHNTHKIRDITIINPYERA